MLLNAKVPETRHRPLAPAKQTAGNHQRAEQERMRAGIGLACCSWELFT